MSGVVIRSRPQVLLEGSPFTSESPLVFQSMTKALHAVWAGYLSLKERAKVAASCKIINKATKEATNLEIKGKCTLKWTELLLYGKAKRGKQIRLECARGISYIHLHGLTHVINQIAAVGKNWQHIKELIFDRRQSIEVPCSTYFTGIPKEKRALITALSFNEEQERGDIIRLLCLFPQATSVCIQGKELDNDVLSYLSHGLKRLQFFNFLDAHRITDDGLASFAERNLELTHLTLHGNHATRGIEAFAKKGSLLTHLSLINCPNINEEIALSFAKNCLNITHIDIEAQAATRNTLSAFAKKGQLVWVRLKESSHIDDESLASLEVCKGLSVLIVKDCGVTAKGINHLIKQCPQLNFIKNIFSQGDRNDPIEYEGVQITYDQALSYPKPKRENVSIPYWSEPAWVNVYSR